MPPRRAQARALLSQVHLQLQGFEVFRHISLGLPTHALAGPLLEAIELLVHVHLDRVLRFVDQEDCSVVAMSQLLRRVKSNVERLLVKLRWIMVKRK